MTNTQYEPDYIVRNNPSQYQSKSPPWALRSNPLLGWPFGHLCLVLMLHSCGKLSLSEGQRLRLQLLAKNLNLPNYILKYYCSAPENSLAGKVRIWQFFSPHLDIFLAFFFILRGSKLLSNYFVSCGNVVSLGLQFEFHFVSGPQSSLACNLRPRRVEIEHRLLLLISACVAGSPLAGLQ